MVWTPKKHTAKDAEDLLTKELELDERVVFVDAENNDGRWRHPPDPNITYQKILWCMLNVNDQFANLKAYYEPTMSREERAKNANLGFFEETIGKGYVGLNWTDDPLGTGPYIPPFHMLIKWDGDAVGCLGPNMHGRYCWGCMKLAYPDLPCGHCGRYDWFGDIRKESGLTITITQDNVIEWMAEAVAEYFNRPDLYVQIGGLQAQRNSAARPQS